MLPRALIFSVFIHLVILAGFQRIVLSQVATGANDVVALQAKLGHHRPAVEHLYPDEPDRPASSSSARSARHPVSRSEQPARSAVVFAPVPASTAASDSQSQKTSPEDYGPLASRQNTLSKENLPDGLNPDGLREYRLNLAREARRFKRYPASARQRGWEGTVTVQISLVRGGTGPVVSQIKSSGFELLDAQAREMMESAIRSAALPDSLRGVQFVIDVPVEYRLEE